MPDPDAGRGGWIARGTEAVDGILTVHPPDTCGVYRRLTGHRRRSFWRNSLVGQDACRTGRWLKRRRVGQVCLVWMLSFLFAPVCRSGFPSGGVVSKLEVLSLEVKKIGTRKIKDTALGVEK